MPPRVPITAKYTASFLAICNGSVLEGHPVLCSVVVVRMVVLVLSVESFSDSEKQIYEQMIVTLSKDNA